MDGYDHDVYLEVPVIQSQPSGRAQRSDERLRGIHCGAGGPAGVPPEGGAADPVAVDRVGWKVIDEKRVAEGLQPVALAKSKRGGYLNMQPEHIEFAGALGPAEAQAAGGDLREDEDGGRNAEAPASGSGAGARDVHLRGGRPQSGRLLAPLRTPHLGNPSANLCS
jgi:hypothetical protein